MKRIKKRISALSIILMGIVFLSFIIIAVAMYRPNLTVEDSSAIYGGIENESDYPFAGYLIGYKNGNQATICGLAFINNNKAVSAAHCIKNDANYYAGDFRFTYLPEQNYKVQNITIDPKWQGNKSSNDVAIIELANNIPMTVFASIQSPNLGCEYEVVGYGNTEDPTQINAFSRPRKIANVCISELKEDVFILEGNKSGICFGDSGSPVFKKGTNEIVGIISSIVTNDTSTPCRIENKASAVRLDTKTDFTNNFENNPVYTKCAQSCELSLCDEGLICNANKLCVSAQNENCVASQNQFCSSKSGISCSNASTCISNKCTTSVELENNTAFVDIATNFQQLFSKDRRNVLAIVVSASLTSIIIILFFKRLVKF